MYCQHCGSTEHFTELCPRPKPKSRIWVAAFSIAFLVIGPAAAIEVTLTDEEKAMCAEQGGCFMLTRSLLDKALRKAFNEGKVACNSST